MPERCGRCGAELLPAFPLCPSCGQDQTLLPERKDPGSTWSPPNETIDARYELRSFLGEGGTGQVYEAWDRTERRSIALKRIKVRSEGALKRLAREGRTARGLEHPHLVRVHDLFLDRPDPYLTMELVAGPSLEGMMGDAEAALEWPRVKDILLQTLDALGALHAAKVVHRDMKPANILVDVERGTAKICDFGLAKIIDVPDLMRLTATGQVVGTFGYMAPEQIRGHPVDPRTDVYGVGVILYRILAGRLPFESTNRMVALYQQAHVQPPPPSRVAPHRKTPPELEAICMWALSVAPSDRPPTARAMADALRTH